MVWLPTQYAARFLSQPQCLTTRVGPSKLDRRLSPQSLLHFRCTSTPSECESSIHLAVVESRRKPGGVSCTSVKLRLGFKLMSLAQVSGNSRFRER
jgi:hypothetical protein